MSNETMVIMLVQQYAAKFGITFSSKLLEDESLKPKIMSMMAEAVSGKRGPFTDEDVLQ